MTRGSQEPSGSGTGSRSGPKVRAVILDLGNVLLFHDNARLFENLARRAGRKAAQLGPSLLAHPLWDAANLGALDASALCHEVCGLLGAKLPEDEFRAPWSSHFTPHHAVFPLVEGLVGRVKLGLLSNTNVLHAEYFRPRLPVLERFDAVLLSHEVGRVKPDPRFYEEAWRRLGVAPEEAAFFDDLPAYVDAARRLGLHAFVFTDAPSFARDLASLGL